MNILKHPILTLKTDSSKLALDIDLTKNFLKVDFENDDELIKKLIKTATTQCETAINKTLVEKTYIYSIYELNNNFILLPYSPIKLIEKIELININSNNNFINKDEYFLDLIGGIINFKNKPNNFYRLDIEYRAGIENINDELIQGLLMHIARMYEDRSGYSPIPINSSNIYRKYKQIKL